MEDHLCALLRRWWWKDGEGYRYRLDGRVLWLHGIRFDPNFGNYDYTAPFQDGNERDWHLGAVLWVLEQEAEG
jgi:hypothetical protein